MRIKKLLTVPLSCLFLATSCICVDWKNHTKRFCLNKGDSNFTLPLFPPPPADDLPNEDDN